MGKDSRLNIRIAPHVAEAVERFKDQLDIDKVCTDALVKRCRELRDAQRDDSGMRTAIARMRAQRADIKSQAKSAGFREGREFLLQGASYEIALELQGLYNRQLKAPMDGLFAALNAVLAGACQPPPFSGGLEETEWSQGFLEGAMDSWLRIRAEVES